MSSGLQGRVFGPAPLFIDQSRVSGYVDATGDDSSQWTEQAPPAFAAAALFAVAPELLGTEEVSRAGGVIHGEQRFTWHRPMRIGTEGAVAGEVVSERWRGEAGFIGFEMRLNDERGELLVSGSSVFVLATTSDGAEPHQEPDATDRGDSESPDRRSASRADLVRYAAASGDFNPIHWDHDSAVAAGLPGIVVHGLLQAAWLSQRAHLTASSAGRALASARLRFRAPLYPATPVTISEDAVENGTQLELASEAGTHLTGSFQFS